MNQDDDGEAGGPQGRRHQPQQPQQPQESYTVECLLASLSRSDVPIEQRRDQLGQFSTVLAGSQRIQSFQAGLQHGAGDVQRTTLDAICQRKSSATPSGVEHLVDHEALLSAVVLLLKRCAGTPASSQTRSICRTCAAVLHTLLLMLLGADGAVEAKDRTTTQRTIRSTEVQGVCQALLTCLAWGLPAEQQMTPAAMASVPPLQRLDTSGRAAATSSSERSKWPSSTIRSPHSTPSLGTFVDFSKQSAGGRSVKRQPSLSSLRSSRSGTTANAAAWDTESAASASELDVDASGEEERRRNAAVYRTVRQRTIACLSALNACAPKDLLLLWPSILCESSTSTGGACLLDVITYDPSPSNRSAACRVLEAYMHVGTTNGFFAGAEERTRLSAFTSLSGRIAATVVQSRARLVVVLNMLVLQGGGGGGGTDTAVTEAVLRCTTALVRATSGAKLRQSHADALRPLTLKFCSSADALVAVRAYALLTALIAGETSNAPPSFTADVLMPTLRDAKTPASVKAGAWNALAASIQSGTTSSAHIVDEDAITELASDQLVSDTDDNVRQAVAAFVLVTLQRDARALVGVDLPQRLAEDILPPIRAVAADCLAICAPNGDRLADLGMRDVDSTVRAAAVRAIGMAIQQSKEAIHVEALRRALTEASSLVRQRASWSWGNLCEAQPRIEYLTDCLTLRHDDDRIGVHAVRGIGALLAGHVGWCDYDVRRTAAAATAQGHSESRLAPYQQQIIDALTWLTSVLQTSKDPKMRWNTCASFGRILTSPSAPHVILLDSELTLGIIALLSDIVARDKTFKTRLTACQALQAAYDQDDDATTTALSHAAALVSENVAYAIQHIDEQTSAASFRESQLHAIPLQRALRKLADRVVVAKEGGQGP